MTVARLQSSNYILGSEDNEMVTEDSDKMFYQMEKKEKSVSDLLQEGFKEEQEND